MLAAHALEAAIDRRDHRRHVEARPHVQLRREAHLDVAHAFVQAVLRQLEGGPLERLGVGEHGAGVGEALQVLGEVAVLLLEHQLAQAVGLGRRQLDAALARQLDQGLDAQRAVEVDVQIGLRQAPQELLGKWHGTSQRWSPARGRRE